MTKKFYDPLYGANVLLIAGVPIDKAIKIAGRYGYDIDMPPMNILGFCHHVRGENKYIVYCEKKTDSGTLMHETLHLCMAVFEHCNVAVGFDFDRHEHLAYYQNYWVDRFRKAMKK